MLKHCTRQLSQIHNNLMQAYASMHGSQLASLQAMHAGVHRIAMNLA